MNVCWYLNFLCCSNCVKANSSTGSRGILKSGPSFYDDLPRTSSAKSVTFSHDNDVLVITPKNRASNPEYYSDDEEMTTLCVQRRSLGGRPASTGRSLGGPPSALPMPPGPPSESSQYSQDVLTFLRKNAVIIRKTFVKIQTIFVSL